MTLLIIYAFAALFFSFLCSIMEAVLLSTTPSYVVALENAGRRAGTILAGFKLDVNRPLAAILSLNTIANTIGAAGVGAQAAAVYGSAAVGVASGILTLLILIFSEIIPKTVGARYWRELAPAVAYLLTGLIWAMYPFVLLSRGVTRAFSKQPQSHGMNIEELQAMADLGEKAGLFRERESSILRNLFNLSGLKVGDVMTPRPVLFTLEANRNVEEVLEDHGQIAFSRLPIYLKTIDSIIGYVLRSDLLSAHFAGRKEVTLMTLKRPIITVPDSLPLSAFLDRLLDGREHIALVIDEFGGTAGIVTMEDVVETLLGMEIVDEADTTEDMQALARDEWEKRSRQLGVVKEPR